MRSVGEHAVKWATPTGLPSPKHSPQHEADNGVHRVLVGENKELWGVTATSRHRVIVLPPWCALFSEGIGRCDVHWTLHIYMMVISWLWGEALWHSDNNSWLSQLINRRSEYLPIWPQGKIQVSSPETLIRCFRADKPPPKMHLLPWETWAFTYPCKLVPHSISLPPRR